MLNVLQRAHGRFYYYNRMSALTQDLQREANLFVFQGLLALEEGDAKAAEIAFRQALSFWEDAAAARSGGGLDFPGRVVAQTCLEWLK